MRKPRVKIGDRGYCRYCGQSIEFWGKEHGGWRDHGGNRECVTYQDEKGNYIKPKTKHARS